MSRSPVSTCGRIGGPPSPQCVPIRRPPPTFRGPAAAEGWGPAGPGPNPTRFNELCRGRNSTEIRSHHRRRPPRSARLAPRQTPSASPRGAILVSRAAAATSPPLLDQLSVRVCAPCGAAVPVLLSGPRLLCCLWCWRLRPWLPPLWRLPPPCRWSPPPPPSAVAAASRRQRPRLPPPPRRWCVAAATMGPLQRRRPLRLRLWLLPPPPPLA